MAFVSLADARAPLTIAIDAGTSSVRALAFDADVRSIELSEEQITYVIDTTSDGGATFSATDLAPLTERAIDGCVRRLGTRANEVAAVGATSFWHSLLGLDESGHPTTPIYFWADTRAGTQATQLRQELDAHANWQRTGCRLHPSYWPAKLRWIEQNEPEQFRSTARWASFPEFVLGTLCSSEASAVTICMASGTGLLDVHNLVWDRQVLDACGITDSQLSPLVDLGPPGKLKAPYRARWPALADARWYPALGDGACANVGSGAIGPVTIALTIGTSAAMRMILPRSTRVSWEIPSGLWGYRLDRENAVLGGALSNGGNFLRWIRETIGAGVDDEVVQAAFALSPDAPGLTILPFLAGERSPSWLDNATGVIAGLTLSTSPEELLRAGMESIGYRLASIKNALDPLADNPYAIVVSGGAILASPSWMEIIADILEHDLDALHPEDETTARGAAIMAMVQEGILDGLDDPAIQQETECIAANSDHAPAYSRAWERQERLESGLREIGQLS